MKFTDLGHIGFNVKNMEEMLHFYCDCLGLKQIFTLTYGDLYRQMKSDIEQGTSPKNMNDNLLTMFKEMSDKPWLTYLQITNGQFLEFFYTYDGKPLAKDLSQKCCYQHCSLVVDDIEAANAELIAKGITPDTKIQMGLDNTKQFWLTDPDGNRIELMEYTSDSLQVTKALE